jgi:hypothetical protein
LIAQETPHGEILSPQLATQETRRRLKLSQKETQLSIYQTASISWTLFHFAFFEKENNFK